MAEYLTAQILHGKFNKDSRLTSRTYNLSVYPQNSDTLLEARKKPYKPKGSRHPSRVRNRLSALLHSVPNALNVQVQ